jgi:hypothetical protein
MIRSLALGLALVVMVTGCQSNNQSAETYDSASGTSLEPLDDSTGYENFPLTEPLGLTLSSTLRFADVPLPVGAIENRDHSYVYQSPKLQLGRMVYNSKASVNELAQFYLTQCPLMGWSLENVVEANGAYLLFEKPDKRLVITIQKSRFKRGSEFVLQFSPKE